MVKVDYEVSIRRSPQEVFEYVTQVERIPEWQREGGVRKVTREAREPLAVGSRFRMERESRGRMATIDCRVTRFDPGREFDFETTDSSGFVGDFRTTLTPIAEGTNLHWAVHMQPPNLLYRLLQPMIRREITRSADADFANLKGTLESGEKGESSGASTRRA
jgi:uncharacterized protein YndB with AHSA1/START domain